MICWDCKKDIDAPDVLITIHGTRYHFHPHCARNVVKNYIIETLHREQAINDKAKEKKDADSLATHLGFQ